MSFRRQGRGRRAVVLLELNDDERGLLRDLFGQVVELVEAPSAESDDAAAAADPLAALVGIGTSTSLPMDPALARLFPNAYNDDAVAASDFRRYTELGLRRRKLEHVAVAVGCLDRPAPVELDPPSVAAWLGALNDLRLVLGSRLGIEQDDDPRDWADDLDVAAYHLYGWLTALQGELLEAID
jgi:hypothetical protein